MREKVKHVWLDRELVEWENATVHVMTHAHYYGTGVFEGIRGYGSGDDVLIFRLTDHITRLINSAKIVGIELPHSKEELMKATVDVIKANGFHEDVYIRPTAFVGLGGVGLNFSDMPVQTAIVAIPFGHYLKPHGVRAMTSTWKRVPPYSMPVHAKATGIYLNSVLAVMEVISRGHDEAILLDWKGNVVEGSGENVFVVKNSKLITLPIYDSILEGITRNTVIEISKDLGFNVVEREITRDELYTADEAFFTGTAAEITP